MGKNKIPGHYNLKDFVSIMTWGGLKGGISLAFIMSARDLLPEDIYNILLTMTMVTILFTTIVQGLTILNIWEKIEKKREEKRLILVKKIDLN